MNAARSYTITRADVDREMVRRRGFAEFVRRAWEIVEPGTSLTWSWHMQAMCDQLESLWIFGGDTPREIGCENRDLVINVPPGMSKSVITSVLWPAWAWTLDAGHRFIAASHNDRVALRDAEKMRTLVKSPWYRECWPHVAIPEGKAQSDAVSIYRTTAGGMRLSTTVRGRLTGDHGDTFIVDDPTDPQGAAASSGIELDETLNWWRGKASTRFRDHRRKAKVLIMQRLHERDLAADMIRGGARVLCLPMRFEANHPYRWAGDPRTVDGDLLCPERLPETECAKIERDDLGPSRTASQFQQRPNPAGGSIFRAEWFEKRWTILPVGGVYCQSWDFKAKDLQTGSYVVGQCWYTVGSNHYLVDQVRFRGGLNDSIQAVRAFSKTWPQAIKKLFEAKANGPPVAEMLKTELSGIQLLETGKSDKPARAVATEPLWAAGNVILPHTTDAVYSDGRRGAPWVAGYIAEHLSFPNGANDDQVDTTSQFLNTVSNSYLSQLRAAMAAR